MEQIHTPKCKDHYNTELNIHCSVHNYMVCSTCTRESHKTCFTNENLRQNQQRNSTVENILTKAKDLVDTKIDNLLELEEWKITTKQEIEHLRERINAYLDQIQSRSVEAMENIYRKEKLMNRKSLLDIEEIKTRGSNLETKSSDMNEKNERLDEIKERLDRLDLESYTKRRPTLSGEMKAILEVVENISSGKIDKNSDMIIVSLNKPEYSVTEQRRSVDCSSDFVEDQEGTDRN